MRADILLSVDSTATYSGAGTNYLVQTPSGVLYCVYVDRGADVVFRKSTNGGLSWSVPTVVYTGTVIGLSVWYDRWSNISAGLIHCAYTETASDDTLYRTIDTESSDALSTQTTIFAGGTAAAVGSSLSICRARGGNVYCYTCIDAGAEGGFFRLPNANVPNGAWDAARTSPEALASNDKIILQPGWAADNQDMLAIYWDTSASEVSRYIYDDSANSWSELLILAATAVGAGSSFPHFAAAVDITNSRSVVVFWTAADTATADLKCYTVSEASIFTKAQVVNSSTDDQGLAAIGIDGNGHWHAFYAGKSDGSETWNTAVNVYTKVSQDSGTTWGPETQVSNGVHSTAWLVTTPRFTGPSVVAYHSTTASDEEMLVNVKLPQRRAIHQMFGG
jgi:hypothetical protein